jgi:hypothetical protein
MKKVSLLFLTFTSLAFSQNFDTSNIFSGTKHIAAGPQYEAGWLHELFWGSHWRDIWATPVNVGILDLDKFAGGLTPTKKGGGYQTKSLCFNGNDGKEYKFRSVNKDPTKALEKMAPGLSESVAADVVQDQISSANPYAPFVTAPLLNAVGVYTSTPVLTVLPDDSNLGHFHSEFGGLMGIIEEVPGEEGLEGSDKVVGSVKLFERLDKEFDESVDSKEFLKARLMDAYFGDWDRHKDQWKWARFDEGERKVYKPFPLDRDQAFFKFDGIIPRIGETMLPQLNHFGSSYPSPKFMSWTGRYLDQRFLAFLTKKEWDSVANDVKSKLTDRVIEDAVKQLPAEIYPLAKDELLEKLKSRRNQLKEYSDEYYNRVNKYVDIYTTNKPDWIDIELLKGEKTRISVFKRNKETLEKEGGSLHSKVFANELTKEIRIYLQDGDDKVVVSGREDDTPTIRIVGGDGQDELVDNGDAKVIFYDDGKKTQIKEGEHTSRNDDKWRSPADSLRKYIEKHKITLSNRKKEELEEELGNLTYDPIIIDKGHLWGGLPYFNYNPDIGPLIGAGAILYEYGFRTLPYVYRMQLILAYAPEKNDFAGLLMDYKGNFYGIVKNSRVDFHARKSGIEISNYFGVGNESSRIDSLYNLGYYKVQHEELFVNPLIEYPAKGLFKFRLGGLVKYFDVKQKESTYVNSFPPYGSSKFSVLGIQGGFNVDSRDNLSAPFSGYYLDVYGTYYPKVFNTRHNFGKLTGDLRTYLYLKTFTDASLGLRLKGEKLWGTFPFFESAFVGGLGSVRGFDRNRFAGDASLFASAELRVKLFNLKFLFPTTWGIFGFGETGRVYLKGEDSRKWHTGYGGGVFMYLVNRDLTFSFSYARSVEKTAAIYFIAGFNF